MKARSVTERAHALDLLLRAAVAHAESGADTELAVLELAARTYARSLTPGERKLLGGAA